MSAGESGHVQNAKGEQRTSKSRAKLVYNNATKTGTTVITFWRTMYRLGRVFAGRYIYNRFAVNRHRVGAKKRQNAGRINPKRRPQSRTFRGANNGPPRVLSGPNLRKSRKYFTRRYPRQEQNCERHILLRERLGTRWHNFLGTCRSFDDIISIHKQGTTWHNCDTTSVVSRNTTTVVSRNTTSFVSRNTTTFMSRNTTSFVARNTTSSVSRNTKTIVSHDTTPLCHVT